MHDLEDLPEKPFICQYVNLTGSERVCVMSSPEEDQITKSEDVSSARTHLGTLSQVSTSYHIDQAAEIRELKNRVESLQLSLQGLATALVEAQQQDPKHNRRHHRPDLLHFLPHLGHVLVKFLDCSMACRLLHLPIHNSAVT